MMKLGLILLMGLILTGMAVADSGNVTYRPYSGWSMDQTHPGNAEMNGGSVNNATLLDTSYLSGCEMTGDIEFTRSYRTRNATEWVHDVKDYGAAGDGITDDTAAFEAAESAMVPGDTFLIPTGCYNLPNGGFIFDPPDGCKLVCNGYICIPETTGGIAFQIGNSSEVRRRYDVSGLSVNSSAVNVTEGRVGIAVVNVQSSRLQFDYTYGFCSNILLLGYNHGVGYNSIYPGYMFNGKYGLNISNVGSGWVKQNSIYDPRFALGSMDSYIPCYEYYVDSAKDYVEAINMYGASFEADNTGHAAASINGYWMTLYSPRIEGVGNIMLTSDSVRCLVLWGRWINIYVTDSGTDNTIIGYADY